MIYLCLEGLEGFVVLDGELVAVVEGFADFVFLELLFVVGRGHCEADFGYAVASADCKKISEGSLV